MVVLAQEEAQGLKHGHIGTEHLLLALLREQRDLGARVLKSLDVTEERTRSQVGRIVPSGGDVTSEHVPLTERAKRALALAMREARQWGQKYIATEHILLGLAREKEGVAARVLLDFGADAEKVRREFMPVLSELGGRDDQRRAQGSMSGAGAKERKSPGSPERQRLEALQRANEIRQGRARLKRAMKIGGVDPAKLFLDPPALIQTAKVVDLLLGAPGWGRVRSNRALEYLRISPTRTVGTLSERQRLVLAELLGHRPEGQAANEP